MQETRKKRRGDRRDGYLVRDIDGMHVLMAHLLPGRIANEAVLNYQFDLTAAEAFLARKNAGEPQFKYTLFHVVLAAIAKTIHIRPLMNRFIIGNRLYDRKDLSFSFVAKNKLSDKGEESLILLNVDREAEISLVDQLHDKVCAEVYKVRDQAQANGTANTIDMLTKLPGWVLHLVVSILKSMDVHGHLPKMIADIDPYRSTVFVSNLGSIKMSADYHHLTNWGTNSVFIIIGEKHPCPYYDENGAVEMRPALKVGITVDERIADGFYFARCIKLVDKLLQHPEVLDDPISAPLPFDLEET